ncbi:uncharacterized protein LOC124446685 isoform X2 [Xenia sp. Carnegie-2017]|uniref:uncharacterized protein LOC124446685 isoform X2 n=1 Tax=Xenia sp. Carnegie-2017 TaxID=2897299 RepID=UPI001F044B6A|nr:uncharacterized protein LOC124446685 isoform X2 [Xenia sp. Carnegie-2017]
MKSTGILAQRPVTTTTSRMPCRAWAEQETHKGYQVHDAQYSAVNEEQKIASIQAEKKQRLTKFQHDVRERIKALEKMKKLQQLDKSYEVVSTQQKVIHQSSFPKKIATAKKDTCLYHEGRHAKLQVAIPGSSKHCYSVVNDPQEVNMANKLFDKQATKVHKCKRHARLVLGSQMLNIDSDKLTELPGGMWNGDFTAHKHDEAGRNTRIQTQPNMLDKDGKMDLAFMPNVCQQVTDELENLSLREGHHNEPNNLQAGIGYFSGKVEAMKYEGDLMHAGIEKQQSKQQVQNQLAIYRKLFMEIEREQVRENLRMKEHRKRMIRLKKTQESKRREVEHEIDGLIEERHKIAQEKSLVETTLMKHNYDRDIIKERKKQQKEREISRYTDALRATLQEKLTKHQLCVPSLCSCGPTVLDSNPETCANNCPFYKNPKGYARALSSIMASSNFNS